MALYRVAKGPGKEYELRFITASYSGCCGFSIIKILERDSVAEREDQEQVNGTYVYSQKHNYIPYIKFTITTVQLHVSAINVGHLQVVHEAPYDKLYLQLSGGTVCGVGWVRDLVVCL